MKLLLAIRTAAVILAVAATLLSMFGTTAAHGRLSKLARLAALTGLGAQLAAAGSNAAHGRAPWTRALLPLAGIAIAVRTFGTGSTLRSLAPFVIFDLAIVVVLR